MFIYGILGSVFSVAGIMCMVTGYVIYAGLAMALAWGSLYMMQELKWGNKP